MQNRYPGTCDCGTWVNAGEGVALKADSKWTVRCDYCERQAKAPEREMLGCVYWPNGMGYTECSAEYEDALEAARVARGDRDAYAETYDSADPEQRERFNALDHAAYQTDTIVQNMLGDGGHLGERITFDAPDPMTALLGGGSVNVAPGGGFKVAQ